MSGKKTIYYWDTSIFISWLKNEKSIPEAELQAIHDLIVQAQKKQIIIATSTITTTEILRIHHDDNDDSFNKFQKFFDEHIYRIAVDNKDCNSINLCRHSSQWGIG